MKSLDTSDYRGGNGFNWPGSTDDEEDGYPLCVSVPCTLREVLTDFIVSTAPLS